MMNQPKSHKHAAAAGRNGPNLRLSPCSFQGPLYVYSCSPPDRTGPVTQTLRSRDPESLPFFADLQVLVSVSDRWR